jgi:hypothetical protein
MITLLRMVGIDIYFPMELTITLKKVRNQLL